MKKKAPARKKPIRKKLPTKKVAAKRKAVTKAVVVAEKTAVETAVAVAVVEPVKIEQPHGGALLAGGAPGNRGGGRPSNEVRDLLRGAISTRVPVIEAIADGEVMQRAEVPLLAVLEYAHCPTCGDKLKPNKGLSAADVLTTTITGKVSASPGDRLKALGLAAQYGLGAKELVIASPQAGTFFDCVHTAIVELYGSDAAAAVKDRAVVLMDQAVKS